MREVTMTAERWKTIRHFTADDFTHPSEMSYRLLLELDALRTILRRPLHISSSTRKDDPNSTHFTSRAVDIVCRDSSSRFAIVQAAFRVGFLRIGVYDHHIHLDIGAPGKPSPVLWIGVSK